MEENVLKSLNKELEGVIMGVNEVIKLKDKAKDCKIKELLDNTLKISEKNRVVLTEEIEYIGGIPTNDEGMWGKIIEVFNSMMEMKIDTDKEVLQQAIKGTEMGFKAILDFLIKEENLREEFKKKLIELSDEYTKNIKDMQEYLITLN